MAPPQAIVAYCSTPNILDRLQTGPVSTALDPTTSNGRQVGSTSSPEQTRKAVQVHCASAIVHAVGKPIMHDMALPGAIAEGGERAECSLGMEEERGNVEMQRVTKITTPPLFVQQDILESQAETEITEDPEHEDAETDMDEYGDLDGGWDKPQVKMEDVYLVEKTYGCLHNDTIEERISSTSILGHFNCQEDATQCARNHLRTGKYLGVRWQTWDQYLGSDRLVDIAAESSHHWYHVRVRKEQRERTQPPFVYIVHKETTTCVLDNGVDDVVERDHDLRVGVFRDRRNANACVRRIQNAVYEQRQVRGCKREKSMVRGLLTITIIWAGEKPPIIGEATTVRTVREKLQ